LCKTCFSAREWRISQLFANQNVEKAHILDSSKN
jgi:hypothetical protein